MAASTTDSSKGIFSLAEFTSWWLWIVKGRTGEAVLESVEFWLHFLQAVWAEINCPQTCVSPAMDCRDTGECME